MRRLAPLVLFLCAFGTAEAARLFDGPAWEFGQPSFTRRTSIVDLNGDGANDLVFALADGDIGVALATGGGSFAPTVRSHPGRSDLYAGMGDVDGDGRPDLVGTAFNHFGPDSSVVFVAFGDGNGGWADTFQVRTPAITEESEAFDLDGDGRSDLVVTLVDSTVAVYRGNANRTMTLVGVYDTPGVCGGIAFGDVVGASAPDVVFGYSEGFPGVSTFEGNGDGTLGARTDTNIGGSSSQLALGALDAQPGLDLALGFPGAATASGTGGGTFGALTVLPSIPSTSRGLAVLDFNGDGKLDIAGTSLANGSRGIVTWLGNGAGIWTQTQLIPQSISSPGGLYPGDVDGDLRIDLGYVGSFTSMFFMSCSQGNGRFGEPELLPVSGRFQGLALGDFDEDGKLDAMVGDTDNTRLGFAHGLGNGRLSSIVFTAGTYPQCVKLVSGRFDADTHLDLVGFTSNSAAFFKGHGDGTFDPGVTYSLGASPGSSIQAADVDGDGDLDVAIPCAGSNQIAVLKQGPGGLAAPAFSPTAAGPVAVRYADLNGDARIDRVVAATGQWVVELENGAGGYATLESHAQNPRPDDLELADLDGDGRLDIALTPGANGSTFLPANLPLWRGQPGGGFANPSFVNLNVVNDPASSTQMGASQVMALDFDGDGKKDLVVRGVGSSPAFAAARGHGDGTFERPEGYSIGFSGRPGLAAGDLDGDGFTDLVSIGTASSQGAPFISQLVTYHNRTAGVVAVPDAPRGAPLALAITRLAPNPTRGVFALSLSAARAGSARVTVVSLAGRTLLERTVALVPGENRVALEGALRPGVYWARAEGPGEAVARKVVVLP